MIQNPIAVRVLYDVDDKNRLFKAMIYAPIQSPEGMYRCLVKLEGAPEDLAEMNGAGVDSYHALQCAMKILSLHVKIFNERHMQGRLRWEYAEDLDLGFSINTDS